MMREFDWVYYNIYSGSILKLDNFVEKLVKPVVAEVKKKFTIDNWFFIRYFDETGAHIRLRFLVDQNEFAEIIDYLEVELNAKARTLVHEVNEVPKRILPINLGGTSHGNESSARAELSLYEPEYKKYGGIIGTELSEKLFSSSSELVIKIVAAINNNNIDRFFLGIRLMEKIIQIQIPNDVEKYEFLERYIDYWARENMRSQSTLSEKFKQAAQSRKQLMENLNKMTFEQEIEEAISEYIIFHEAIFKKIVSYPEIEVESHEFCFNYIHMMNNRLGIWPIEEAYLAALLLAEYSETVKS